MKILTFSSLYPNAVSPSHGVFVEHRLRQLLAYSDEVQAKVVAPVPWFPFKSDRFGVYARFAQVAPRENRHGIDVIHPRYLVVPKVGMNLTPKFLYRGAIGAVKQLLRDGYDFDVIDAHYFYPDGVAAMWIAQQTGKPFVVTGRGTDLNLIPQFVKPRAYIQQVIDRAGHMMTVATALHDYLFDMGAKAENVSTLRNGVDLNLFVPPVDREALRQRLGLTRKTLISAGHLIERKGHHLAIGAMASLPDHDLLIVGDGEEESALKQQVNELGLRDRVRFVGRVSQSVLVSYYGAADALILASSREGWANVLLESMACGTPVVASPVDGTPEVVASHAAGVLMTDRTPACIVAGVKALFQDPPLRADTRAYAEQFDWDETSQGQIDIFRRVVDQYAGRSQP